MSQHLRDQWRTLRREAVSAPPVLYHYTSLMHFSAIERAGFLMRTSSNITMGGAGPAVVWLTTTASAMGNGLQGSWQDKGEVRISVPTSGLPVFHWPTWAFEQGIDPIWYDALASASEGDPEAWWVCTREIPIAGLTVEYRTGSGYGAAE